MKYRYIKILFLILITVCMLFVSCGENPEPSETYTDEAETTAFESAETSRHAESETESEAVTDGNVGTLGEAETTVYEVHDKSEYRGLVISRVYGNGRKSDAPIDRGFIELTNTSDTAIGLDGLSVYVRKSQDKSFSSFAFTDGELQPQKSLLLSCSQASVYNSTNCLVNVSQADFECGLTIDNGDIILYIAPTGAENIESSYVARFMSSNEDDAEGFDVCGMSKNKIAVLEDGKYKLYNLTHLQKEDIEAVIPDGCEFVRTAFESVYFSQPAGFYEQEFTLELTCSDGYTIFYTTDGSDPVEYGKEYTGGIKLERSDEMAWGDTIKQAINYFGGGYTPSAISMPGGRVIRAYATDGENKTDVFTSTYFIIPGFEAYNTTVFNMSLNVDDFISEDDGAYYTYQYDLWNTRPRSTAYIEVFDKSGGRVGHSYMEFAVSGNGSSGINMKSLRLYWKNGENDSTHNQDELAYDLFEGYASDAYGNNITSFSRILIRNSGNDYGSTYLRDSFCQRLAYGTNVNSMAYTQVLVFVNGEFWGLYNCRERYSQEYYESHYGVEKENAVLIENISPLANGSYNSDYVLAQGDEGDEQDFLDLYKYICDNNPGEQEVYDYIASKFDIDSYIDYWIFNTYLGNGDWPGNNIKVMRNKNPDDPSGMDTKWRYCLLDMDFCVGLCCNADYNMFGCASYGTVNGTIMHRLMKNQTFKEQFAKRAYYVVENILKAEYSLPIFEEMVDEKSPLISLQTARWGGSYDSWESSLESIRSFLTQRRDYYIPQLCDFCGVTLEWLEENAYCAVEIYFDTEKVSVTVNGREIKQNGQLTAVINGQNNIKINATAKDGCTVTGIELIDAAGESVAYDNADAALTANGRVRLLVHTEIPSN